MDHLSLIAHWRYLILVPLLILEGPAVTFLAASLAARGEFNNYAIFGLSVVCTLIGDALYYAVGRYGGLLFITRWGRYIGVSAPRVAGLERFFQHHGGKTLVLGKLSLLLDSVVVIAAGIIRYPFGRFMGYNLVTEVPKSLVIVVMGYFFGNTIGNFNHYATEYAVVFMAVIGVVIASYRTLRRES